MEEAEKCILADEVTSEPTDTEYNTSIKEAIALIYNVFPPAGVC